jgi:hypothetical protein
VPGSAEGFTLAFDGFSGPHKYFLDKTCSCTVNSQVDNVHLHVTALANELSLSVDAVTGEVSRSHRSHPLVGDTGFYEWRRDGKIRQPFCFEVNDGRLFAFAGLWDRWTDPQGDTIESYTILTTTPNSLLADIHERMPVILRADNFDLWLDPAFRDLASVSRMLRPFEPALMRRYPVSTRLNQVQNDDADCAKPVKLDSAPTQSFLF